MLIFDMGMFDFLKRRKTEKVSVIYKRDKISRIEYLMGLSHESMEQRVKSWGGLNFIELVERQLKEGKTDLAFGNLGAHVNQYFRLAILYWGQEDIKNAQLYLNKALERHERLLEVSTNLKANNWPHYANRDAKAAACLLEKSYTVFKKDENKNGYLPWFAETILDYCLGKNDFDETSWQDATLTIT